MKQIPFNLNIEEEYNIEDYIVSCCNVEPYKLVQNHAIWPFGRLLIIGEEGSGKTHLCNIWKSIVSAVELKDGDSYQKYKSSKQGFILENIDTIKNEDYLFHLINFCQNQSQYLLMTAQTLPSFELVDLKSRINASQKVMIKQPDEALLHIVLNKYLIDRQLVVPQEVCDYVLLRAERSFAFIKTFVEQIDFLSLKEKRNITIPLVKKVLVEKMLVSMDEQSREAN